MSVRTAIIADDFTGGLFVASNLEKLGIPVFYVCDPGVVKEASDRQVLVIATRLRFMPPAQAVAALDSLTTMLDEIGAEHANRIEPFDGRLAVAMDHLMELDDGLTGMRLHRQAAPPRFL